MYIVGWVFPDRMLKASTLILERRSQVGNSGNCWGGYGVRVETMGAHGNTLLIQGQSSTGQE